MINESRTETVTKQVEHVWFHRRVESQLGDSTGSIIKEKSPDNNTPRNVKGTNVPLQDVIDELQTITKNTNTSAKSMLAINTLICALGSYQNMTISQQLRALLWAQDGDKFVCKDLAQNYIPMCTKQITLYLFVQVVRTYFLTSNVSTLFPQNIYNPY